MAKKGPRTINEPTAVLLSEICQLIEQARSHVARQVNFDLVMLNWKIGSRIYRNISTNDRSKYGSQVVEALGRQLSMQYGRAFDRSALFRMVQLVKYFPEERIIATLARKIGWSHFVELLPIDDELKRNFYAEMCAVEGWSVRTLRDKMRRMLFERTAISKKPEDVAMQEIALLRERGELSPDLVFRDPYLLDFLGLTGVYDEKDVENAILRELEKFLLEMGTDFSFVGRQRRLVIDGEDHYVDLLFYHRRLRSLVVIELKLERFKAEHKGRMELYLKWLNKYERREGEAAPIGLILCAGKSKEQVELLSLDASGIRVAEYVTEALPKQVLAEKLLKAIRYAGEHLAHAGALERIEQNIPKLEGKKVAPDDK